MSWAHQPRALAEVRGHWTGGVRAVCLVAPTGAGKTRMGEDAVADFGAVVWLAHRRELVKQTAERLRRRFGREAVGVIMPGEHPSPRARIQVATVQALLGRELRPRADVLVLDEAHHYVAAEWVQVVAAYPDAKVLGLTATPERADGEPLGDVFGALVVAASYSELIAAGCLVPCRVHRPAEKLGNDLAQPTIEAYRKYSEGSRAFVFCARVEIAYAEAQTFRDHGIPAGTIEAMTPKAERDELLERFRRGTLKVLTNVNTMTEGVDVPEARCCILAKGFGHVGQYLQAVGRVLRAAKGKSDAILIDLTGTSLDHGLPTDDRSYSLSGRAISGGGSFGGGGVAPDFTQSVRGIELEMVARGALPPAVAPVPVEVRAIDDAERRKEYEGLVRAARTHGLRPRVAAIQFRDRFGTWPAEEWGNVE
jgi:DNA repair protein RadD